MANDTDTNALVFERLKILMQADASLSDDLKIALTADCESAPPAVNLLKKLFEDKDASIKQA